MGSGRAGQALGHGPVGPELVEPFADEALPVTVGVVGGGFVKQ